MDEVHEGLKIVTGMPWKRSDRSPFFYLCTMRASMSWPDPFTTPSSRLRLALVLICQPLRPEKAIYISFKERMSPVICGFRRCIDLNCNKIVDTVTKNATI
jgi:hypothetical protein